MRRRVVFVAVAVAVMLAGVVGGAGSAGASTPTLSKTTGLRFYERVAVHTGAASGATVLIFQCFDVDGTALDRCVPLARTNVPASGDVDVVLMRRAESRNPANGTALFFDCLAAGTSCSVRVQGPAGETIIPVTFDPAAPVPVLSVTPNSNLGWSTATTVHGSGFLPGQEMLVTQCARRTATAEVGCTGVVYQPHPTADETGAFTFPLKVRRLVGGTPFNPSGAVDCAHTDCFVRAVLPPINREDRPPYLKGAVDAALDVADDGIPIALIRKITRQTEGHLPEVEINVDLMAPATSPLTITYSTGSVPPGIGFESATAGSDYVAKLNHHLYFLPGETHHQVRIAILDDDISEPTVEQFAVNYSGYFHANTRTSLINIANDDH